MIDMSHLDMPDVRQHYLNRRSTHRLLLKHLKDGDKNAYVMLALGITDPSGNYSAAERGLGYLILKPRGGEDRVFDLAQKIMACPGPRQLPPLIQRADIPYLKISVGSEMAAMLRPNEFWVGNVRTIWCHLLVKHNEDYDKANEELELYREGDWGSEMAYPIWADIYVKMDKNLRVIEKDGNAEAKSQKVKIGKLRYLWIDAICNAMYDFEP